MPPPPSTSGGALMGGRRKQRRAEASNVEQEVKLAAPVAFRLPALNDLLPGGGLRSGVPRELDATYFDAPDLRLARAGITLRHRLEDGTAVWTLKLPELSGGSAGSLSRTEINRPAATAEAGEDDGLASGPPEELVDLVAARLRTAPLQPVVRLRTVRVWLALLAPDGGVVAEVVDDDVSVLQGEHVTQRFREIEVELGPAGTDADLDRVVDRLVGAGAGEPDPTPKAVRALGSRAGEPPELVEVPLSDEPTAAEVMLAGIRSSVLRLIDHDPVVRADRDLEGVHQARVATRRLRSDLRVYQPLLEEDWVRSLRDDLGELGRALGEVRDTDVMRLRLRRQIDDLDALDWPAALELLEKLRAQREAAMAELLTMLHSAEYLALLDRLVVAASGDMPFTPLGERPAQEVLPTLAQAPYKSLSKGVHKISKSEPDAELHRLRIKAKRARYAAELASGVVGAPAQRLADELGELQDVLGDHQDACVARAWLRAAAVGESAEVAVVAGQLMEMERVEAAANRSSWRPVWKAAKKDELRSWMS
jgi:CHAD domain-containing protein